MIKDRFSIDNIPVIIWGEKKNKVYIAVHGNMSNKEDMVIALLANEAVKKGYQVLSFDLPEHGERKNDSTPCKVQNCVCELAKIMEYAKKNWIDISLFACSMGAYFSLLAYKDQCIKKALFLSPVVNMERIIENMMTYFHITQEQLQKEKVINTPIGQKLYWDYFCYVKEHPILTWKADTEIMYGAGDTLCEFKIIEAFAEKYHCGLEVVKSGEHYFHTDEQLSIFSKWVSKNIN